MSQDERRMNLLTFNKDILKSSLSFVQVVLFFDFVPEGGKDEFSNLVSYTYKIKLGRSRVTRRPNEIFLTGDGRTG